MTFQRCTNPRYAVKKHETWTAPGCQSALDNPDIQLRISTGSVEVYDPHIQLVNIGISCCNTGILGAQGDLSALQRRLFEVAIFGRIVMEDPAETSQLTTRYLFPEEEYGGADRAFPRGALSGWL